MQKGVIFLVAFNFTLLQFPVAWQITPMLVGAVTRTSAGKTSVSVVTLGIKIIMVMLS